MKKFIQLLTLFAFLFSMVITPAQAADMAATPRVQEKSVLLKRMTPPSELGEVVDASEASAASNVPSVIHIQDLHANYSVQSNIAKLLAFYDRQLGAGTYKVAVEGAEGPILITKAGAIANRAFKEEMSDRLMKVAELTGTEYFAIVNGHTDLLWGVEDKRYHEANLSLFKKTYSAKESLSRTLQTVENQLQPIKKRYYTRTMRKLDQKAAAYVAGKVGMESFSKSLVRQAGKCGIDVAHNYPEIASLTGAAPDAPFVNIDKLMTEQSRLLQEIETRMAKNDVQKNIVQASSRINLLKRLTSEELTTEEVRTLAPQLAEVTGQIQQLLDATKTSYDKKNYAEVVTASLDFYALALLRDQYLANNALALLKDSKIKTVVLVSGGFHTPGITEILKKNHVSYLTVTPMVASHTAKDKQLYLSRLLGRHVDPDSIVNGTQLLSDRLNGAMAFVAARVFGMDVAKTGITPPSDIQLDYVAGDDLGNPGAPPVRTRAELNQIATDLGSFEGGVLAADESEPTAGKRLDSVGLENNTENRQSMRQMMLTPEGLKEAGINGVILYAETLGNVDSQGRNLVQEHLVARGIRAGLKTDTGMIDDPDYPGEKIPKPDSIEKLGALLDRAKAAGATFTKWRTTIRAKNPSPENIRKSSAVQAAQARMTQDAGLVPMVEPEVVFDGSDGTDAKHSLADAYASTTLALETTFDELNRAGVWLDSMVLKTSMILAGKKAEQTDAETVGFETLKGLLKTVPAEVPTIVFLSGGQSDNQATENMDAVARASTSRFIEARDAAVAELRAEGKSERADQLAGLAKTPWEISYSFGRGLQARALKAWGGRAELFNAGQQEMIATVQEVRSARQGNLSGYRFAQASKALATDPEAARVLTAANFSEPIAHEVISLEGHFKSAVTPGKDDPYFSQPRRFPLLAATWIGIILLAGNLFNIAKGLDKSKDKTEVERRKEHVDLVAQVVQDHVARLLGLRLRHRSFETKGEIKGGVEAGQVGGDLNGKEVDVVSDVIEGTSAFAFELPGASSMHLDGEGAHTFGEFPDEVRGLTVATNIDNDRIPGALRHFNAKGIKDLLDPVLPADELIRRIAYLNNTTPDNIMVTTLPNGDGNGGFAEVKELERLKVEFPNLVINSITGGTVRPTIPAILGQKSGKVQVFLGRTGMTEGVWTTYFARAFHHTGAIVNFRVVNEKKIKRDKSSWRDWPQDELLAKLQERQPERWQKITSEEGLIFSSYDVKGEVQGSYTFLTDGEKDDSWPIAIPGIKQVPGAGATFEAHSIEFASGGRVQLSRDRFLLRQPLSSKVVEAITSRSSVLEIKLNELFLMRRGRVAAEVVDEFRQALPGTHVQSNGNSLLIVLSSRGTASTATAQANADRALVLQTIRQIGQKNDGALLLRPRRLASFSKMNDDALAKAVAIQSHTAAEGAGHRPVRSLVFAGLFGGLASFFVGPVIAAVIAGWFIIRAAVGSSRNRAQGVEGLLNQLVTPSANSAQAQEAGAFDVAEEVLQAPGYLPAWMSGTLPKTSAFNRVWNETFGEVFGNLLSLPLTLVGLVVVGFQRLQGPAVNPSLYNALTTMLGQAVAEVREVSEAGVAVMRANGLQEAALKKEKENLFQRAVRAAA